MTQEIVQVTALKSDFVRNCLSEEEWKRVVFYMHCYDFRSDNDRPNCTMSGMWWAKIDKRYDEPGEEQYRCPDCKTVYSIKVPLKREDIGE